MTRTPGRGRTVVVSAIAPAIEPANATSPAHAEDPGNPGAPAEPTPPRNPFDRMTAYLGREYAAMKRGTDITLEQLLARLHAATRDNRRLRKDASALMMLIATDIRTARDFPLPGVPVNPHRPMRAWRQRYNGLDRFLPKPS